MLQRKNAIRESAGVCPSGTIHEKDEHRELFLLASVLDKNTGIALIHTRSSGRNHMSRCQNRSISGVRSWLSCIIMSCVHAHASTVNGDRGKTRNACRHRNRCDAGWPHIFPSWEPPLASPNPVEYPKAEALGSHVPSAHAFLSSARNHLCLILYQRDPALRHQSDVSSFHRPRFWGSAHAVCPNVKVKQRLDTAIAPPRLWCTVWPADRY